MSRLPAIVQIGLNRNREGNRLAMDQWLVAAGTFVPLLYTVAAQCGTFPSRDSSLWDAPQESGFPNQNADVPKVLREF